MKKSSDNFAARYISLAVFFLFICVLYIARLINIQISGRDLYSLTKYAAYTRTVKIQAHRGEIYDREGRPLVVNKTTYNFIFDYGSLPQGNSARNAAILDFISTMETGGGFDRVILPQSPALPYEGSYPNYRFRGDLAESGRVINYYLRLLRENDLKENMDINEFTKVFLRLYGLTDKNGNPLYEPADIDLLFALRYDMDQTQFSPLQPYIIARDVDMPLIIRVREAGLAGVAVRESLTREYCYPGYASHLLGMIGVITDKTAEYYSALGYPADAYVGLSGAEAVFEEYLRGIDGKMVIVEDAYGNIIDQYISSEPAAGNNIRLTIDIELQKTAEDALASNIAYIVDLAAANDGDLDGEDASRGALVAINTKTGELLAAASYPTYDLSTYRTEYSIIESNPDKPLFNKAFQEIYEPGSTFKIGVAAAALAEGIVTPNTVIVDKGIYTYYPTYQPRCWRYLMFGLTHGSVDVIKAIQESCNYYFFEVGRLLTIEKMNEYMQKLGLGAPTGIEFAESVPMLAGPASSEISGTEWFPGDTLRAAIGQADKITPLQLSVYMSTLVNGGTRYRAHVLHSVRRFHSDEVVLAAEPEIMSTVTMTSINYTTLMNAMKSVTENGSAARVFNNYPILVGGKTGTAQTTSTKSDNAIFVAFAPFDNPEIAVSCIIEQGANGTNAGFAVRDVFDAYFGY